MQKILAIDDKRDNLVTLSALLKNLMPGCAVITAQSGLEGIEKARAELPDAILLDVKMPEMDGFETCRRLISDESTKHIPVIMITTIKTKKQNRIKGLEVGANTFLSKPIDEYELVSQVNVALRIKKAEDALREERNLLGQVVEERTASLREEITERKQAEKALRESEEKYREIIENMQECYHEVDIKGNFTFFNESMRKIIGYEREELLGMNNRQYADEENTHKVYQVYNRVYRTGEPVKNFEWQIIRKDGDRRDIEVSISLIRDAEGHPTGFRGFVRDTTERKRAEESMRESEERFKSLYQGSPIPTFTWQKKEDDFILVDFNHAAIQMTNGKVVDSLGDSALELSGNRPHVLSDMNLCYKEQSAIRREITSQHFAPGRFLSVNYGFIPPDLIIVHTEDKTNRKQAEEALRESEERYRSLVENASEAVYVAQDGMLKFVNRAGVEIAGYSEQELISKPFIEFIHPDDRAMAGERYLKRLRGEVFESRFTFRLIAKNGDIKWLESGAVLINYEGRPATLNVVTDITERKRVEKHLQDTLDSLRKAVSATIRVIASAVETRDPYTAGHQIRSADLARAIAAEMGLPQEKIDGIRMAGSIHDIGKLSIPAEILSKPTKLSEIEFSLIKEHSHRGYEILKDVESPWPLAEMVLQHHERMDGSGYPRNLKGDDILIEARILAVADVVESMASHRPYRPTLGIDAALEEIEKNRGTLYDEPVVDACVRLFREKGYRLAEA